MKRSDIKVAVKELVACLDGAHRRADMLVQMTERSPSKAERALAARYQVFRSQLEVLLVDVKAQEGLE